MSKPGNAVCDPATGVCKYVASADAGGGCQGGSISASHPVLQLLGTASLLGKQGPVPTASLVGPGKILGIYFSAHWCPPCKAFTPEFAEFYKKFKTQHSMKDDFTVIYVSSDRDQDSFNQYYSEMPWLALPFVERETKARLSKKFKVQGIPTLLILDGNTGQVITDNGRDQVSADPEAADFPWVPKPFSAVVAGELVDREGRSHQASEALAGKVKIVYFSAHWCPPCRKFTPDLVAAYTKLKAAGKNVELVFVSGDRDAAQFDEYLKDMPWLAIPYQDKERNKALSDFFQVEGIPSLLVVSEDDKIINRDGRAAIAADPEGLNFPWAPKLFDELNEATVGAVNEAPVVVLFVSGDAKRAQAVGTSILLPVATKAKEAGVDDLLFFYGSVGDELVARVQEFSGVSSAATTLVVLDVPSQESFTCEVVGEQLTPQVAEDFVTKYVKGQLKGEPLSG